MDWLWVCIILHMWTVYGQESAVKPCENVTSSDDGRTFLIDENNHNFLEQTCLLHITSTSVVPTISWLYADKSFRNSFTNESDEYTLWSTEAFDYESGNSQYSFAINLKQALVVVLNIRNIDDEAPNLASPTCSFEENRLYDASASPCKVLVADADGWLSQMKFELDSQTEYFRFEFETDPDELLKIANISITVIKELDYESTNFYSFFVNAKDDAGHPTTPSESVRTLINVDDVNDMPPEWTQYISNTQIQEQTIVNFAVKAIDGDKGINASIAYKIGDAEDCDSICDCDENGSCVTIDTEGNIIVRPIDRDSKDIQTYTFSVVAYEVETPEMESLPMDINLYIEDIDNHRPIIEWVFAEGQNVTRPNNVEASFGSIEIQINENFVGTLDMQISIKDIDTGENAQFSVELLESNDIAFTEAFLIVPTSGYRQGNFKISVTDSSKLDYEDPEWREITFDVLTKGDLNNSKTDKLTVNIELNDINDEVPVFDKTEFSETVLETIGNGSLIITVLANDADKEDAVLTHSLIGSFVTDLIKIDPKNGDIHVNQENAFDFDRVNPIFFQVQAEDAAGHKTTVPVTINLKDVDNKAPVINVGSTIEVGENLGNNIIFASISASDVDQISLLTAEIKWDDSYAKKNSKLQEIRDEDQFFELEYKKQEGKNDIDIVLITKPDSENKPDYEYFDSLFLVIEVSDINTDEAFLNKKSTNETILITIVDKNDNAPVFEDTEGLIAIDKASENTFIGSIFAKDEDASDIVTYSCEGPQDESDWFNFGPTNGVITVKSEVNADLPIYNVTYLCTASDTVHFVPHNVTIDIIDKNDQDPVILTEGPINTEEEQPEQKPIVKIETKDGDRDEAFKTVRCKFSQSDTTVDCSENFTITTDNELRFRKKLDRDFGPAQYNCLITCYDNPEAISDEQRTDQVQLTIVLTDVNDNAPQLLTQSLVTSENLEQGGKIGVIVAQDMDEGNNALVSFSISKVVSNENEIDDIFEIIPFVTQDGQKTTSTLVAKKDLKSLYGDYEIHLELSDNPKERLKNTGDGDILIKVDKWNYEEPKFVVPSEDGTHFIFLSKQLIGQPLQLFENVNGNTYFPDIQIYNENNDCTEKWQISITVYQTEPASSDNIFTIVANNNDRCSAQLQISDNYNVDTALKTNYTFEIKASFISDRGILDGEKPYEATTIIYAQFLDNAADPIFPEPRTWSVKFLEDDATQEITLPNEKKAFYPGLTTQPSVFYYLLNDTDKFDLSETQELPIISLKEALDFDTDESFTLMILATNETSGTSMHIESYLTVEVEVIDVNNHAPEWTKINFFGGITDATTTGSRVVTADATDRDTMDRDALHYQILQETLQPVGASLQNIDSPFKMNQDNGEISLNFRVESTMTGYFTFDVQVEDNEDAYGNSARINTTSVTITILTGDYTMDFKFENPLIEVTPKETEMLQIIGDVLGKNCYTMKIQEDSINGKPLDNQTIATLYFIEDDNTPIKSDVIEKIIGEDITKFSKMRSDLRKEGLVLMNFDTKEVTQNLEGTLRTWLIGVSITLGALLLIIIIAFIIKLKQLNNRLKNLTTQKFGSEESGLNRLGINAPTTNQHAIEGSNPVFSNDVIKRDLGKDFDQASVNSGDSYLIGVEDNAEFDFYNRLQNDSSEYI